MTSHSAKHKSSAVKSKQQILDAHILTLFGEMQLDPFRPADVDVFQVDMLETKDRKTVNNICSGLSSVLKYAKKDGVIGSVGFSFFLKAQPPELRAVSQEEIEVLLEATEDQRYRVAILLACDAGMRVGELRAVRSLSYWAVRDKLHALYDAADIDKPPNVWHCLRHAFCTLLAESGTPVHVIKDLAGHASIETTLRYMHTSQREKNRAIASAFGRSASRRSGSRVASLLRVGPSCSHDFSVNLVWNGSGCHGLMTAFFATAGQDAVWPAQRESREDLPRPLQPVLACPPSPPRKPF
jgi:integrase